MSESEETVSKSEYAMTVAGSTDGGDRVPDLSPREAFDRWMGKLRVDKSDATVSSYHYRLKLFVEWCEDNGITQIGEVSGWDIETYETARRQQDIEPVTLNKEMLTLRDFLSYCARIELVDESLPEKVDPPEVGKQADVDETRLEPDHAQALLDYYDANDYGSRDHAVLSVFWYTGARLTAVRGLDFDHYNSGEAFLEFLHQPEYDLPLKNGADGERAVGLPDYVVDVLDEYISENRFEKYDDDGKRPLFTTTRGRMGQNTVRARMYLATVPCLHSECPHGNVRETCEYVDYSQASKCPSSRAPHQIRTGSITWQLNRGVPIETVAARVNTSVRVLKKHYDMPTRREELEERRRGEIDKLAFDDGGDGE
jgi:site-specific recombinase XerD